ncbi:MAG: molybdopterin cofactor-binding domain-containing protein, partial [Candidatus Aerophobetes bacterium]|nr:molybdopterin cofactor-binding domain-containing protein [Candidatus Aerophobetes bacterium]
PLKIREVNYIKREKRLPAGQLIKSEVALPETSSRAWKALGGPRKSKKGKRIGRGFASGMQSYGRLTMLHDSSRAWVGIEMDASLVIRTGVPDLGGGQGSSLVQIASETLGIPGKDISIHITDSSLTPLAGTTTATRQLYMSGNAVLKASINLKEIILNKASQMLNISREELDLVDKKVVVKKGKQKIFLVDVVKEMAADGIRRNSFAMFNAPFSEALNSEMEQYKRVFPDFTFGTQAAEVEVDEETGKVKVTQLVSSYDVGKVINRNSLEGQMEGGAIMGMGYALLEDIKTERGVIQAQNLAQYLIPTSLDIPEVKTVILESETGLGPFGAKGIGEPSMTPTAAAIANAVYDATGVRFTSLPITPEKIIIALKKKE